MRARHDRGVGEAAILLADRVEIGVVQRLARPPPRGEFGGDGGTGRGMVGIEQAGAAIRERARLDT